MPSVFLILLMVIAGNVSADYQEQLERMVANCEQIPAFKSHSGLVLNPEGYQAYWERSACYQKLAIRFRKSSYCEKVFQRYALFSSSWGYSKKTCKKRVAEEREKDKAYLLSLRDQFARTPVILVDLDIIKNGNGKDFDVIPLFTWGYKSSYEMTLSLIDEQAERYDIAKTSFLLGEDRPDIRWFIRRQMFEDAMPGFDDKEQYIVESRLTASVSVGRSNSVWDPNWIESVWPRKERSMVFSRLKVIKPWQPISL